MEEQQYLGQPLRRVAVESVGGYAFGLCLVLSASCTVDSKYAEYQRELADKLYSFGAEPPQPLASTLEEIRAYLSENYRPDSDALQPGLAPERIEQMLGDAGFAVLEEIRVLYAWHDGQSAAAAVEPQLFPPSRFLPLREAIEQHRLLDAATGAFATELWGRSRLPFLAFQDGFVAVACDGERKGVVYEILLENPEPNVAYESLASFMAEQAAYYREGAYGVSDEGLLTTDEAKMEAVFARYHPRLQPSFAFIEASRREVAGEDGTRIVNIQYRFGSERRQVFDATDRLLSQVDLRYGRPYQSFTNSYDGSGVLVARRYGEGMNVRWLYGADREVTIEHSYPKAIEVRRGVLHDGKRLAIHTLERRAR